MTKTSVSPPANSMTRDQTWSVQEIMRREKELTERKKGTKTVHPFIKIKNKLKLVSLVSSSLQVLNHACIHLLAAFLHWKCHPDTISISLGICQLKILLSPVSMESPLFPTQPVLVVLEVVPRKHMPFILFSR